MDREEVDELVEEAISQILDRVLSIPGVYNTLLAAAVEKYGDRDMKVLYNDGCTRLTDLPRYYLWQHIKGT